VEIDAGSIAQIRAIEAMRAKIIDRWQELEAGVQPVLNLRDPVQIAQVGNFRGK
jgi:hypothetical protein